MITAMYIFFRKVHDVHGDAVASKHLAGLKPASDSACKTLAEQAAMYDVELAMYNDKLCENLSHHILDIATPAAPPPALPALQHLRTSQKLLCCAQSMFVCLPCLTISQRLCVCHASEETAVHLRDQPGLSCVPCVVVCCPRILESCCKACQFCFQADFCKNMRECDKTLLGCLS